MARLSSALRKRRGIPLRASATSCANVARFIFSPLLPYARTLLLEEHDDGLQCHVGRVGQSAAPENTRTCPWPHALDRVAWAFRFDGHGESGCRTFGSTFL